MAICIYCRNNADSREHWIPRGLGTFRGFTPLLERLCEGCNQRLGRELDQELMRTGQVGFQRAFLGIEGRHNTPSTPYRYKTMRAVPPTTMKMPAFKGTHEVLAEGYKEGGRHVARALRQVVLKMSDERLECVPFSKHWTAEHLKSAVVERGFEKGRPFQLYLDDDEDGRDANSAEMVKVQQILFEVFGPCGVDVFGGEGETVPRLALRTDAGISIAYIRAIAKAAFHYFLWALPAIQGDEPSFALIRDFISGGIGNWRFFVDIEAPQFLSPLRDQMVPPQMSHYFSVALKSDEAIAFVQFFVGPNDLPPPARVRIGANPLLNHKQMVACHQARYFDSDAERADGHHGELIQLRVGSL